MNWRTASSVCGEVGFAATELDDARVVEADEPSKDDEPRLPDVPDDGSGGGWWRRRNRAPLGVKKAEMYAVAGGYVSMCLRYLGGALVSI